MRTPGSAIYADYTISTDIHSDSSMMASVATISVDAETTEWSLQLPEILQEMR